MIILAAAAAALAVASGAPDLDTCARLVARARNDEAGYRCFRDVANREGSYAAALARVEAILATEPGNDLARWNAAALEGAMGGHRGRVLYETAIQGFASRGEAVREAGARLDWAAVLQRAGGQDEAEAQLTKVRDLVSKFGDEVLRADLAVAEARQAFRRGDYSDAETHLASVEPRVTAHGDTAQRASWLSAKGSLGWARARFPEALAAYKEEARIWGTLGDRFDQAAALANVALLTSQTGRRGDLTDEERRRIGALLGEADTMARAGGNLRIRGTVALYRAQLAKDPADIRRSLEQAVEILDRAGDLSNRLVATRMLAEALVLNEPRDPARSTRLLADATDLAYGHGDLDAVARCRMIEAMLAWRLGDERGWNAVQRTHAVALTGEAIDAIEALRDLQADDGVRAEVFTKWVFFYDRILGHLLVGASGVPSRADIAEAFELSERMRARVLLEKLDVAGVPLASSSRADRLSDLHRLVEEAARLRVELSSPHLPDADRSSRVERLRKIADEEEASRRTLAAEDPRFAALRATEIPSLDQVESALEADEAVLAFTTGSGLKKSGYIGGGSWLLVHTRGGTRVYRVPDEETLAPEATVFAGLFDSRDGREAAGAVHLYDALLREGIVGLPSGVRRLVVVPDGPLHLVPFSALRPARDDPPLVARFTVEFAPSVTTWLRWKRSPQAPLPPAAFVIADPQAESSVEKGSRDSLGSLPEARREARALVSRLAGPSRVLEGDQATEAAIKSARLDDYGVLHVAAHARLEDPRHAQASLLLHPESGKDDGRLTVAEASSLDLGGRIVSLAACRTAGGAFLEGEGVQSLARGFLAAGARAVVGSLWPLRDDEAAEFFDAYYRRLGQGAAAAEAFTYAQRERIAAGAPAAAWAGLVLVGDGSVRLEPARSVPRATSVGVLAVLLIAAAALIALLRHLEGRPKASNLDS